MISRLRPIDVSVSFDDRDYKLGESIDATIDMKPNRDCLVREGRVDIVLEERWTEEYTFSDEQPIISATADSGAGQAGTETITKEVKKKHRETSIYGMVTFLQDEELTSGREVTRKVRVNIKPDRPAHAREGATSWWLQTVIDVAGARDVKPRHKVKISAL